MADAVIIEAVRTPLGRGRPGGALARVHPVDLLAHPLAALVERTGLDPRVIDDVIVGCVSQIGEQSTNIARRAALAAGYPERVPATTVDRQCGSGQQAIQFGRALSPGLGSVPRREAPMNQVIETERLVKVFRSRKGQVRALDGLDLQVAEGTILGLLGANGAGKTTAVRILATLMRPDGGRALVAGVDVVKDPDAVRRNIGLSGQYAAVDEYLSGFENLVMVGRLYKKPKAQARERAHELLERFDLVEAADRPVKGYSGGMRRRLDLAAALVAAPPVLFLDEPTTGLDPRSRNQMWDVMRDLVHGGTTVLLTTQYLEEADRLADQIVVIDRGRAIAQGAPDELKLKVGGERVELVLLDVADREAATQVLASVGTAEPTADGDGRSISVPVTGGAADLRAVLAGLSRAGVEVSDVGLRRPTLDDVFLTLTGHAAEDETKGDEA